MTAWKVSGLSHSPAIIASRPASIRLAIATSPSRESSPIVPISRRYIRTGSSVRSIGSLASDFAGVFGVTSTEFAGLGLLALGPLARLLVGLGLLGLDHVDAHLVEHRQNVLDLLGSDLLQGHDRIELLVGDVAALRGLIDQLRDGGVGEIEKRQQGIWDLGTLLQRFFLLRCCLGLVCHQSLHARR